MVFLVKVKEVMKKNVITIDPEITIADAAKIMTNNRIGSLVIMEGDKPKAIFTDGNIISAIAYGMDPKKTKVKEALSRKELITADPDENVLDVTKKMVKNGVKRLPVVKDGKLLGIICDKELLLIEPAMINILSEKLKMKVESVAQPDQEIEGICENCGGFSYSLRNVDGRWLCEGCRNQ
ncbi:MAG: hypothetical protein DRP13_01960 [Candidatus Aenigmatarchaeota archaeon]|nr:MAG: hypothetical protein DRP18_01685 [Candidatus Aenigmarchaeota archaeon]RLJ08806.1 MAG: hypothetical protein DRP13_01960 [Candidatus Aenigmarchaeota archaeon]